MLLLLQHAEARPAGPLLVGIRIRRLLRLLRAHLLELERIGTIPSRKKGWHAVLPLAHARVAWEDFSNTEDHSFWCCTGTGVEEYSKINDSIYWHDDKGLYVNLFIPSELNWAERGFKLRAGNQIPRAAEHHARGQRRQADPNGSVPASSGMGEMARR